MAEPGGVAAVPELAPVAVGERERARGGAARSVKTEKKWEVAQSHDNSITINKRNTAHQ